jgi:methyl farnesoate epoxidase/farnesoate epoxidase
LDDERLEILTKLIHESFRIIDMSGGILNQFPEIRHIMPDLSGYRPLVNTLKPLWVFLKEAITEIGKYPKHVDKYNSLIEAFLKESTSGKKDPSFTEEQLLSLSLDLFQAGSETTSNTLGFGLIYMLHHPQVARKVQEELTTVVGNNRLPKLADRPNLPYTEATLNEIQRLSNVAPLGIVHRAMAQTKLGGYKVPQGALAIVLLYSLHMDKDYWKDPKVFRPERFLNETGDAVVQHENFLPFGSGKRRCMGEHLAKSSLFLFFASFMHSFDMAHDGRLPDMEGVDGITLSPKPFSVILKDRLM